MLGLRENAMSATPITDKIIEDADACPETRIVFLIKNLANKCREFERMYNAALVCAGVAPKIWRAAERELQTPSAEAVAAAKEWLPVLEQELLSRKGPLLTRPFITLAKEILRLANNEAA